MDDYSKAMLGDYAETLVDQLGAYFQGHMALSADMPETIRLDAYPAELMATVLANESAHPLLTMSHIDGKGYPFITVMGFSFIDGKIHITSRKNGLKIKRLQENPKCTMVYHNNIPRPEGLGCVTLVGKARISHDAERIRLANEILSHKVYRDGDPDVDRRQPMIDSMQDAERVLVILDEVEAVYMITPMAPNLPSGVPTPPIAWRADWQQ